MDNKNTFNENTYKKLTGIGLIIGLIVVTVWYHTLQDMLPDLVSMGDRVWFTLKWMVVSVLSVVIWFLAVAFSRLSEWYLNGRLPDTGSKTEIKRRYLQNTMEQFMIFFVVMLGFTTISPQEALVIVPVQAVMFLIARIFFLNGYLKKPEYRGLWSGISHVNLLIMFYVIFKVITGS